MYEEPRPTCVTVIAWVWMVIGGLSALSGVFDIAMHSLIGTMTVDAPGPVPEVPAVFRYVIILGVLQAQLGAVGAFAGYRLLHCERWARLTLEMLTSRRPR